MTSVTTACRICAGNCALKVDLDDQGFITAIHGDREDPVTRGYACIKGLTLHEAHYSSERLHHPLKRRPDGSLAPIVLDEALDEIADRLSGLIDRHGPNAVAAFKGTMAYTNFLANAMLPAFLGALGSSALYSTMTIDQSAKWVTFERLGGWAAGKDPFEVADVLLMVGTNPLVSLSTFNFALQNPVKQMREARQRGLKLVVIDPRRSETAQHADVHLQSLPGEDAVVLAGLLHVIFERGWHDAEFCRLHVDGLDRLKRAIAPFTPSYVAERASIAAADLVAAAALFAEPMRDARGERRKRGSAASGTGPDMARHANLAEHLLECLNVVCGRFARPGDSVPNPGVLGPRLTRTAEVIPPRRSWEAHGPRSPSGYGMLFGERMTGSLPDDILADAANRVRALIVVGGNPASAIPQTDKTVRALGDLDLIVTIDPFLTSTSRLADYILPPRMMFERFELGSRDYESIVLQKPYVHYTRPIIEPPAGSQCVEDWVVLWELARRLGRVIELDGVRLDMRRRPTSEQLMALLLRQSAVPFEEICNGDGGRIFDAEPMQVQPGNPSPAARFAVVPADVLAELKKVRSEPPAEPGFTHRFAVRRVRDVQNSMYHRLPTISQRMSANPAFLNPEDLAALGFTDGQRAAIISPHGRVTAVVRGDITLRRGVVAMSHGWGPVSAGDDEPGTNVNLLTSAEPRDPINAMPVMTGFPVRLELLNDAAAEDRPRS